MRPAYVRHGRMPTRLGLPQLRVSCCLGRPRRQQLTRSCGRNLARYAPAMIFVDGQSNERLILDGEWFEKQRGGQPKTRVPASSFQSAQWAEIERRTKLFGGD